MSEISESTMQAVLMRWAMFEKNHVLVAPNSTMVFPWEADLISVTRAHYSHEYEIKISSADYKRDFEKVMKHNCLQWPKFEKTPNYFWYATFAFDIDPPEYAGWIKITKGNAGRPYIIDVKKEAPRLHTEKLSEKKMFEIGRLLAFRAANYYSHLIQWPGEASENAVLSEKLTEIQEQALAL